MVLNLNKKDDRGPSKEILRQLQQKTVAKAVLAVDIRSSKRHLMCYKLVTRWSMAHALDTMHGCGLNNEMRTQTKTRMY